MAKSAHDREDLLRDGKQMPIRGLTYVEGNELFVGFRVMGQMSLYWNQDPVFQFNLAKQLRRVFFRGERYAAQDNQLCQLVQNGNDAQHEVTKLHLDWHPIHQEAFVEIEQSFNRIQAAILGHDFLSWNTVGELDAAAFHARVVDWLAGLSSPLSIAISPNA